ncbi:MAG: tol-pal system YbgF family protein [Syntrophobacteraceae bacterium]
MIYGNFGKVLAALLLFVLVAGCRTKISYVTQTVPVPTFPPQKCMECGDYAGFLAENQKLVSECTEEKPCEEAMFNLGFLYAYSKSPYYNRAKALQYFDDLGKKYPQSPLSFQATAWSDLLKQQLAAEKTKRVLKGKLRSKDTVLKDKDTVLKDKETTINDLQQQIKRSTEIDTEIDQKERELLH